MLCSKRFGGDCDKHSFICMFTTKKHHYVIRLAPVTLAVLNIASEKKYLVASIYFNFKIIFFIHFTHTLLNRGNIL